MLLVGLHVNLRVGSAYSYTYHQRTDWIGPSSLEQEGEYVIAIEAAQLQDPPRLELVPGALAGPASVDDSRGSRGHCIA